MGIKVVNNLGKYMGGTAPDTTSRSTTPADEIASTTPATEPVVIRSTASTYKPEVTWRDKDEKKDRKNISPTTPEPKTIGERIKYHRTRKGMSQKVLAELLHVDKTVVSKWEGGRLPKQDMIDALADALDVTPIYLVYGRNDALAPNLVDLDGLTFRQIALIKDLIEELRKGC